MTATTNRFLNTCFVILFILSVTVTACSDGGDDVPTPVLDGPVLVNSTPVDGATDLAEGSITITLTFDQNVTSPSSTHSLVTLSDATVTSVVASLTKVTIKATGLEKGNTYQLVVPKGVVLGPTKVAATQVIISFSIQEEVQTAITTSLAIDNPSQQAQNVYNFLVENYGQKVLSGAMANVNWNTNEAEWVKLQTGKYPAIATFDYVHLPYSPANWVDYSNTTIQQDWWNNNGLISAGWHWIVPTAEGATDYTYKPEETTFKASNATIDGTWENDLVKADLKKTADYLKLLQAKNIPVIWRPLHEAAGNIYEFSGGSAWFWWGADGAEAYKDLWIYMFDYFKTQGLNNLIWVWTTQTKDREFYPGDNYVDIVGRDIYNNSKTLDIADEFASIQENYPTKMVTLSECGNAANISAQWNAEAQWSFFMPWYDYERTDDVNESDFGETSHEHADATWWTDAFNHSDVITRDQMPSLK
ncbi:glycosyl hydrolase [Sunxiuqinia indica]|uniref:glycosyl hydrolase n=1 Tax=Sunxiuqinia indica TaxID=2692584 RepID=UPI001359BB0A|nr:glycosyl hydrolase [Sunxiuqinia indica]